MGYNNDLINTTSLLSPPWFHCLCLLSWYWEGFYGKAGNWEWQGNDHSCINDSTPLALVQSEGKQSSSGTFSLFFEECIVSVLCWYSYNDDMFWLFVSRSDKQIRKEIEKIEREGRITLFSFEFFCLFLLNSCLLKEQHTRARMQHTHTHTHAHTAHYGSDERYGRHHARLLTIYWLWLASWSSGAPIVRQWSSVGDPPSTSPLSSPFHFRSSLHPWVIVCRQLIANYW